MSVQDPKGKKILRTAVLLSLVTGRVPQFYFILKTIKSNYTSPMLHRHTDCETDLIVKLCVVLFAAVYSPSVASLC